MRVPFRSAAAGLARTRLSAFHARPGRNFQVNSKIL
jgi:hypothetical protein